MDLEATIVTYEDIFQYEAEKKGRYTDEYRNLSAAIILDKQDMVALGLKDGDRVQVENDISKVVVSAKASEDDPHPGLAFMTNSPWFNQLVSDDACDTGIPGFKGIKAKVSSCKENVTQISDLLQRMRA